MDDGKVVLGFDPADPDGELVVLSEHERKIIEEGDISVTCITHGVVGYVKDSQGVYDLQVKHAEEFHPRRYIQMMKGYTSE